MFSHIFHSSPATYFSHRECVGLFCVDADTMGGGGPIEQRGGPCLVFKLFMAILPANVT